MARIKEYYPNREMLIRYLEYSEKNALGLIEHYKKSKNSLYKEDARLHITSFLLWLYRCRGGKITFFEMHEDKNSELGAIEKKGKRNEKT